MLYNTYPIDVIRRYLRLGAIGRAEKLIDKLPRHDISGLIQNTTAAEGRALFEVLFIPTRMARSLKEYSRDDLAALMVFIDDDRLLSVVSELGGAQLTRFMSLLPSDRRATLRRQLQARARSFTLAVRPVSMFMEPVPMTLLPSMTVEQAREGLGKRTSHAGALYVVDRDRRLLGQVSPNRLKDTTAQDPIERCMEPLPTLVRSDMPVKDVLPLLADATLATLPVIDRCGRLLGELKTELIRELLSDAWIDLPVTNPQPATGWRRFLPWFAVSCLVAVGSAGWALEVFSF